MRSHLCGLLANGLLLITAIWGWLCCSGGGYELPVTVLTMMRGFCRCCEDLLPLVIFYYRNWLPQSSVDGVHWILGAWDNSVRCRFSSRLGLLLNASNAGFITGLYMVLVPIIGLALKLRPGLMRSALAVIGLFLRSVKADDHGLWRHPCLSVQWLGAAFSIDHFASRAAPLLLALGQFIVCGVLAVGVSVVWRPPHGNAYGDEWLIMPEL